MRSLSMVPRLKESPLRRGEVRGLCPDMRENYPDARRTYNARVKVTAARNQAMAASHIFRIMFVNQGKVYEVYARRVTHGELFGFIEVEELLFGERSSVVLDPSEERIKGEFSGVKRTFLPLHSVLRIDEVKKHGTAKITVLEGSGNVAQFPMPIYSSPPGEKK
jgi:hypothetical protein